MDHATSIDLIRWIVWAPLIGALLNGLLGARLNRRGEHLISLVGCGSVAVSFALALMVIGRLLALPGEARFLVDHVYTWMHVGSFRADVAERGAQGPTRRARRSRTPAASRPLTGRQGSKAPFGVRFMRPAPTTRLAEAWNR